MNIEYTVVGPQGGIGGGVLPVTSFADSFHRIDQPFMLGTFWLCTPGQHSTITSGSALASSINVSGVPGTANFSICSSNGLNDIYCTPIPLTWNIVQTSSQFSQSRIVADNSIVIASARCGPMVLADPNVDSCYAILTEIDANIFRYSRFNNNTETILGNGFALALNDVLKIQADFTSTPGTTIVKIFNNGILQDTFNDNGGSRLTYGLFGYYDNFISAGVTHSIDNYSGGIL